MRPRSFRLRIMALSVAISGMVLAIFGISGGWLLYQRGVEAVDQQIRDLGQRELQVHAPEEHWSHLEHALQFVYSKQPGAVVVLVRDHRGEILYRSPEWPDGLAPESFPVPDPSDDAPPAEPRPRQEPARQGRPFPREEEFPPPRDHRGPPGPGPQPWDRPPIPVSAQTFRTLRTPDGWWRIGAIGVPELTLSIGVSLEELAAELRRIGTAYLTALPLALLLVAGGGWLIARRALEPIRALTETAESITASGLGSRVETERADAELARLITVFNGMLDRLERSFQQAARFSADAAHELKTPLAILQGELEEALQAAEDGSELQLTFGRLLEEARRLKAITQKLLLLARADAGPLPLQLEPVDLSRMAVVAAEDAEALADSLTVEAEIEPEICLDADRRLLQQLFLNLTENTVKYSKPGGTIRIVLERRDAQALFSITNPSEEIPEGDHERIFERFYRCSASRGREQSGSGLGLSIAREIARAHGGDLILAESQGGITRFVLRVPIRGGKQ